jgi:hypothetical protein
VRGSYGRYVGGSSGASTNPGPGADDVNPNEIITKTYSNWDGRIPYVPVEANLTSVSGGGSQRFIDLDLTAPSVDEWTAGVDLGLSRVLTVQFNYVKKIDGNQWQRRNLALPFEAWTETVTRVDPGRDNVTGTADDQPLVVHSVPRTYPGFGQTQDWIVQTSKAGSRSTYDAFGVTLNKQHSARWSFLASFDASRRDLADIDPRNPNEALYGPADNDELVLGDATDDQYMRRLPEWHYAVRFSGTYQFPWGIMFASSFTGQSGEYFGRDVLVRDALNQAVYITVEPQAGRYEWVKLWDNRISKRFKTWGSQSIEGMFDLFNTLNVNTITAQTNRNGSAYLQPTTIIAPRVFRLGVRYRF